MDILTNDQWRTLCAIADAIVPSIPAEALTQAAPAYALTKDYKKILIEFAADRPSDHPEFKLILAHDMLPNLYPNTLHDFRGTLDMLNQPATCLVLTGTYKLFHTLSVEDRQAIIDSWGSARLSIFRRLYRGFFSTTICAYLRASDIAHRGIRHPVRDLNVDDNERYASKDFYRFHMLTELELQRAKFDTVIIGSGCGAGVVAARLSSQGFSVLVIEKGNYYHQEELTFSEHEGLKHMYEAGGVLQTEDGGVNLLAALDIRWWLDSQLECEVYEDALCHVWKRMGVTDRQVVHSRANQILLDGSSRIGSAAHAVAQNTGGFIHRCSFCSYGCRFGEKQGGTNTWLVDAAINGAKFLNNATVEKVLTFAGAATGVQVKAFGKEFSIPALVVVAAAGSLNTPVILVKSGFKNSNIGNHLKLHPVGTLYGIWNDKDFNAFNEAILTANNMAAYMSLARDKGEGRVYPDHISGEPRVSYELSKFDRNSIISGLIKIAELCLAQDVDEIYISDRRVPTFIPTAEMREKGILSKEFKAWTDSVRKYGCAKYTSQIGSAHQMSTCRMGSSPRISAATPCGELWECEDLVVTDGSALPSASGANPKISIMATAHVIAGNIVERLKAKKTRAGL
ncbi:hypothetical protein V1524DRAFT_405111 [Lipomyces starkeyi]